MMKFCLKNFLLVFALALSLSACDTDISGSPEEPSAGRADFTTFVAIGDSLTAGYADSALYRPAQENSYPAIMAQQFELVGGDAFSQPLMPVGATGKLSLTGSSEIGNLTNHRLMLTATGNPESPAAPRPISRQQTTSIDTRVGNGGFNNLGVPGAKLYHVPFPGYGTLNGAVVDAGGANPFFTRFSSSDGSSMLLDALALTPTFFVFWVGNNDIFLYAAEGGVGEDRTDNPNVGTYGPENDITDPGYFENGFPGLGLPSYAEMVAALTAGGAKGVLVNIPNVNAIPYFTTVPFNPVELTQAQADELNGNASIMGYNAGIASQSGVTITPEEAARRTLVWKKGLNPLLITDDELTNLSGGGLPSIRLATAADFILLPTSSKIGTDNGFGFLWGVSTALEDGDVLTEDEAGFVEAARQRYNTTIKNTADASPDLLYFDMEALLDQLNESGILYGSGGVSATFAQGGAFSLDGIHLTARGNAVISNEMFKVINDGFDAYIPPVDPSQYTTVFYQ